MKNKYIKIVFFTVIASMFACDFELDKVNPNSVTLDVFYKNEGDLTNAVNATYAVLQGHQLVAREWFFIHDMRGDDMASAGGHLEAPRAQLLSGTHNAANQVMTEVWTALYGMVHRANIVMNKAPEVEMENEATRKRLVAEVKFLQAWAYLELVTIWGGVPIYDDYVTDYTQSQPRATSQAVFEKINTLLTQAIPDLSEEYTGNNIGRATSGAARALLARAYLHQGNYSNAKTQLQAIIDSEVYDLTPSYNDNFLEETEYNIESVFEVGFRDSNTSFGWGVQLGDGLNQETTLRNQEYNPISWRNAIPSNPLLEDFEHVDKGDVKNDPRFAYSFYRIGDVYNQGNDVLTVGDVRAGTVARIRGEDIIISWRKHSLMYKTNSGYYPSGLNERILRYADVLLMMAECVNETDESAQAEANVLVYLNKTRRRADVMMPDYPTANWPTATKEQRRKAIIHERRIELCGEAIRDMDIARWRKHNKLDYEPIGYFVPNKHELLPLPQTEIDNNPKIENSDQNPGY